MTPTPELSVLVGQATDVGRVREHNEDALLVAPPVYAVCDGMGGHAAGEVASRIVVETLVELARTKDVEGRALVAGLAEANARLLASTRAHPEQSGMGTTAVVLALSGKVGEPQWVLANVGDSRAYRFCDEQIVQLTTDHSEVQELQDAGLLTAQQAATHPMRHIITRSIGMDPAPEPDVVTLPVRAGERVLLCSDGLTGELADEAIAEILSHHPDPQAAAEALVRAACDAGGRDNVTVVLVEPAG